MDKFQKLFKAEHRQCIVYTILINLIIATFSIGIIMLSQHGKLMISNDFNALIIPNYIFNNQAILKGDIFWNWNIELGSDFISTFGTKLVNPFYWITFWCSAAQLPYVIGWVIVLKYVISAVTAYLYIQRFLDKKCYAVIGATLYAFSGYQSCNIVFYFFHDYVSFFPLLLISLEELIENKRHFFFSCMVTWAALKSISTFEGEVVFCIIYYIFRFWDKGLKTFLKGVVVCFWEGILGLGLGMILLLTQIYNTSQLPRATTIIQGKDGLSFDTVSIIGNLKAFILPAESMTYQVMDSLKNWYSTAAYLPFIGGALVITYIWNRKDWISRLLKCCFVMAMVPFFNSAFMYFSQEGYHRWYYMPILVMSLASAIVLEKRHEFEILKGYCVIAGIIIFFICYCGLLPWSIENRIIITDFNGFVKLLFCGVSGYVTSYLFITKIKNTKIYFIAMICGVALISAVTTVFTIKQYIMHDEYTSEEAYNSIVLTGVELKKISSGLDNNYRYSIFDGYYNRSQIAYVMTNYAFESCVHNSIFKFYHALGANRTIQTPINLPPGTPELLSTKYIVTNEKKEGWDTNIYFNNGSEEIYVYTNAAALPIGFCYNTYMLKNEFMDLPTDDRAMVMLNTLVINEEDEEKVSKLLKKYEKEELLYFDKLNDVMLMRNRNSSLKFEKNTHGFSCVIKTEYPQYAFFSVPYDEKCWTAIVNGEEKEIIEVNGLMAVEVDKGINVIEFLYYNIWIQIGAVITGVSVIIMIAYWLIMHKLRSKSIVYDSEKRG